jgi:hypothetical protein
MLPTILLNSSYSKVLIPISLFYLYFVTFKAMFIISMGGEINWNDKI